MKKSTKKSTKKSENTAAQPANQNPTAAMIACESGFRTSVTAQVYAIVYVADENRKPAIDAKGKPATVYTVKAENAEALALALARAHRLPIRFPEAATAAA
jgi:hypothetical protein